MTQEIQEKIQNIDLIVDEIVKFPQTYETILKDEKKNGTYQFILRRKLNSLIKMGVVQKTNIPGTRFGKVIYYCDSKKYYILVEAGRMGSIVYCFFDYKKLSKFYVQLDDYWVLDESEWIKRNNKIIFEGNVLKFL